MVDETPDFGRHVIGIISEVNDLTADEKIDLVEMSDEIISIQIQALKGKDIALQLDMTAAALHEIAADKTVPGYKLMQNALTGFLAKTLLKLTPAQ